VQEQPVRRVQLEPQQPMPEPAVAVREVLPESQAFPIRLRPEKKRQARKVPVSRRAESQQVVLPQA
jgi:hypothetical protein